MKSKDEMLMRELRKLDPAASQELVEDRGDPCVDDALLQRILATDPSEGRDRGIAPRRGWLRSRWILAPVAAGTVGVVAAVLLVGGGGDGRGPIGPLSEVAAAAASQPSPPASTIGFSKVRFSSIDTAIAGGESWSVYSTEVREEWRSEFEPGRLRVVSSPPRFVGPGDKAAWEAAGSPNFLADHSGNTVERTLPPESEAGDEGTGVSGLPTDPDALYEELSQRAKETDNSAPPAVRTLLLIGEYLQNPAASSDLRASLYRAAERIPGIQYFGATEDEAGRSGVAIGMESSYSGGPTRYELIWDPDTSEVLATTALVLEPVVFADARPPFPLTTTLFLESRP
jgi:hypothetical protein